MKKFKRFRNCEKLQEQLTTVLENNSAANGWRTAFEETLKIIDEQYSIGRRGVHALENVRRAICDEIGVTKKAKQILDQDTLRYVLQLIKDSPSRPMNGGYLSSAEWICRKINNKLNEDTSKSD